ncbi:osiris 24 [Sergentomyia squamirostris]
MMRNAMSLGRLSVIIAVTLLHWVAAAESMAKSENVGKMQEESLSQLGNMVLDWVDESLQRGHIEVFPGVTIERNHSVSHDESRSFSSVQKRFRDFADSSVVNVDVARAIGTARVFFFKGLKKMMWPLFIGLQVVKTALLALFLPSLIGSLGKIVGKGLSSVSSFGQQQEPVEDLEFKDTSYLDTDNNYVTGTGNTMTMGQNGGTSFMQPDKYGNGGYGDGATSETQNNIVTFGPNGQKVSFMMSPDGGYYSKFGNGMMSAKRDDFKIFHDIPASSMLLTNYDPFYSPLLSRLDAIFQQLGLSAGREACRQKLVCLMYASPAKYAPYSNLISAQLSRELNELKKPSSDNPDIMRFFKYMKAAKDGQDGVSCDMMHRDCLDLKDNTSPAMITTFNDINKLVHARKLIR